MAQRSTTTPQPNNPQPQFVDRPELSETFADTVRHVTFDGATVRAELCVTRVQDGSGGAQNTKRYPTARIVMRPDAAVDLFIQLQRLVAMMEQRGIIKRQPRPNAAETESAASLENPLGSGKNG